MTELELYRLAGEPAVLALAALSFVKGAWQLRVFAAACAAVLGLVIGLLSMALKQAGVPWWAAWILVAPLLLAALWRWKKRRPTDG